MKEKPEDSQLSTLSDDNIIVRATYTSLLLYQELFPLNFTQNENKRWRNSQYYRLKKRKKIYLDHRIFYRLIIYVKAYSTVRHI